MHIERMKKWASAVANFSGTFYLGFWADYNSDGSMKCGCAGAIATLVFDELEMVGMRGLTARNGHVVYYDGHYDYTAIAKFFGIQVSDAVSITSPSEYHRGSATPKDEVVARIYQFIEHEEQSRHEAIVTAFHLDNLLGAPPVRELEAA
jgi:hypothetical protein